MHNYYFQAQATAERVGRLQQEAENLRRARAAATPKLALSVARTLHAWANRLEERHSHHELRTLNVRTQKA